MQLTYPGVYVTEIPSSVRPIATVSTSVGAFVDYFSEGDTTRAVQVFGMADFERYFGGIDANSKSSYQIAQFFLNGGSSAWIVRVAPNAAVATYPTSGTAVVQAINPGSWGNALRISIEPTADPTGKVFNVYVSRYKSADDPGPPIVSEKYLNVSTDPANARHFIEVINHASQLVQFVSGASLPTATGTVGGAISTAASPAWSTLDTKTFTVTYTSGSGTATQYTATLSYSATINDPRALRGAVEAAIRNAAPTGGGLTPPSLAGATVTLIGNFFVVETSSRASNYDPGARLTFADGTGAIASTAGLSGSGVSVQPQELSLGNGTAGWVDSKVAGVRESIATGNLSFHAAQFATALIGDQNLKTGMYALEDVDLFNLLSIPVSVELGASIFTAIASQAVAFCEQRRAMFLVDIPSDIDKPQKMIDWCNDNATTINSANAAVYFPRVELPDPENLYRLASFANSGTIAGIYARTDTDRGVWKAPAGIDATLSGVAGLDYSLTDGENGALNPLGINCLRVFPVYGMVTWGARTTVGADAMADQWKYIPVRRLALMIEESLFRGTKWVVFEPNDEPLWAKIRQNVGAFMMNLFRQGAFAGSTPSQAFFVKCDSTTTTPTDQNNGVVNIQVGFAPLDPAEFVVLQIQQIPDLT